jgi:uncharacterized membrane protein YfhO
MLTVSIGKRNQLVMKNLQNQIGKKLQMKKTFSNHKGSLVENEKVILILVNEQSQELKVTDPFGIDWIIPFDCKE